MATKLATGTVIANGNNRPNGPRETHLENNDVDNHFENVQIRFNPIYLQMESSKRKNQPQLDHTMFATLNSILSSERQFPI